jgi:hypothetical protein
MTGAIRAALAAAATALLVSACGGDSGRAVPDVSGPDISGPSAYAGKCAPDNPLARDGSGNLLARYGNGTLDDERRWVRSYMNEAYLWYAEMPSADPTLAAFNATPAPAALDAWFDALKTPALTPSGGRKDRYSFTMPTAQWNSMSQSGVIGGYGIEWVVSSGTRPREARVGYVETGSPAAAGGVARGDRLLAVTVDGTRIDFVDTAVPAEIDQLNATLFSPSTGTRTTLTLRSNGGLERDVPLVAGDVRTTPVKEARVIDGGGDRIGYLLLNDFIVPAEGQLRDAVQSFKDAGVQDLVLDLRYNGGGYLYIASQLAWMVAPTRNTVGKTFERSVYSDKRQNAGTRMQFFGSGSGQPGSSTTVGAPLPNLGLARVYVLAGKGTCSASESVINGLRGVDVEVILLGGTTCGKPYGFTARDNCGLSYFPVEFQGVNEKGFGDFADGFAPTCAVSDDLERPLGSESEGLLAAALAYRSGATCAAIAAEAKAAVGRGEREAAAQGVIVRPPWRSNKFLQP